MNRHNLPTDVNRTKRAQSLRKISLEKVKPLTQNYGPGNEVALKHLVQEIMKYFMEIVEVLLLQQNSNHFLDFMKKTQEMNRQLQRKMEYLINEKCEELANLISKNEKDQRLDKQSRVDRNAGLKKERKQVARSIINIHRSNSYNVQLKSAQYLLQATHSKAEKVSVEAIEKDSFQQKEMKTSMELNSINSQITELEKSQSNSIQQLKKQLQAKLEYNFRDIEKLNQKHVQFKLKFEQKLQQNLTALWNVISDIKTSVFNLENLIQK